MTQKQNVPYESDAQYLDCEFAWLRCYIKLIDAKKHMADISKFHTDHRGRHVGQIEPVSSTELQRRVTELEAQTKSLRDELDDRIKAHRKDGGFRLGLDFICEESGLTDQERILLLVLILPTISTTLCEDIYAPLDLYSGSPRVSQLIEILQPKGTEDSLRYRLLFMVGAPLLRKSLIILDYPSSINTSASIHSADVYITQKAFAVIVGMPELARDGSGTSADNAADGDEG